MAGGHGKPPAGQRPPEPVVASLRILVDLVCSHGSGRGAGGVVASRSRNCATTRSIGRSGVT
jgi:hypothetical protein